MSIVSLNTYALNQVFVFIVGFKISQIGVLESNTFITQKHDYVKFKWRLVIFAEMYYQNILIGLRVMIFDIHVEWQLTSSWKIA